ncbi:MAG: tetratricopeptide (TPR) repeat protein [Planctomycetota bacterium]
MNRFIRTQWALSSLLLAAILPCCKDSAPPPSPPDVAALGRLIPSIKEDLVEATERVRQDPDNGELWAKLGVRYEIHSAPGAALVCYAVASDHLPTHARWPYRAALSAGRTENPEVALVWIERSIELDPTYPTSFYRKGNWLLELGRLEEAKQAYQKAASLAPTHSETWAGLARVALQADEPELALALVKKARKLDSTDAYLHLLFGITLSQLERESEAVVHLALGQGSSPSVNDPWSRIASGGRTADHNLLERGRAMEAKGDWSGAIRTYREIMASRPGEVRLPIRLARTLLQAGRGREALQLVEETLIRYPSHLGLLIFYGALLIKQDDLVGAWKACTQALMTSPDRPDAYIFKSTLLAREGKHREALMAANTAVDKDPASSRAYEAQAQRYGALKQPWDAVRVLETAFQQEGFKPSVRFYQMLMEGLTAIKRPDKLPPILQRAQADYGTEVFPN